MHAHTFITLLLHSLYIQKNLCFYYIWKKKISAFKGLAKKNYYDGLFLKGNGYKIAVYMLKFREQKGLQTYAVRFVCLIRSQGHFICFQDKPYCGLTVLISSPRTSSFDLCLCQAYFHL